MLDGCGTKLRFKQLATNRQYDLHTIQYAYDGILRLSDADYYPAANLSSPFRAYDYAYDPAGNRTQKVVTVDGSPTTTNYSYNALNQLTGDGANSYTYDDNGSLTSDGVNSYTWDRANRLLGMGGHSYAYNGLSQRVGQTVDSVVTQYLLDVQPELWKVLAATASGQTERYLHGPLGIHAQEDNIGDWRWTVPDALGSVRGEFDADLDVQAMRDYAPYGDPFGEQGTFASQYGFTGEPVDANGLVHLRARYYSPMQSRFLNTDPKRLEENLYIYATSNPVNLHDPTGSVAEFPNIPNTCLPGYPDPTDHFSEAILADLTALERYGVYVVSGTGADIHDRGRLSPDEQGEITKAITTNILHVVESGSTTE
jgi:RHS repeat-associated protein